MNDYNKAWEALADAIGHEQETSGGIFGNHEGLSTDQRLKAAEVAALLSISQELSAIRHMGINPEYDPE